MSNSQSNVSVSTRLQKLSRVIPLITMLVNGIALSTHPASYPQMEYPSEISADRQNININVNINLINRR